LLDRCNIDARPLLDRRNIDVKTGAELGKTARKGALSLFMRQFVRVDDVLTVFPDHKKSWAYKQLRAARTSGRHGPALVSELAEHLGLSEQELREVLGGVFMQHRKT
jgi:hypothetical protein